MKQHDYLYVSSAWFKRISILLILLLFPYSLMAACDAMVTADVVEDDVEITEIAKCMAAGQAPPKKYRVQNGRGILEPKNTIPANFCRPWINNACPNALGVFTDLFNMPPNWRPEFIANLLMEEIGWNQMQQSQLPCGGTTTLSRVVLENMWGNVRFTIGQPALPQLKNMLLSGLNSALSSLTNHANCQDGKFWGILGGAINTVLPQLTGGESISKHVYNVANQIFTVPDSTYIALPAGTQIQADLMFSDVSFTVPEGGSFQDISGRTIELPPAATAHFMQNGTVQTSTGQYFRVDPKEILDFTANEGILQLPEGAQAPVLHKTTIIPKGPVSTPPKWWNDEIHE